MSRKKANPWLAFAGEVLGAMMKTAPIVKLGQRDALLVRDAFTNLAIASGFPIGVALDAWRRAKKTGHFSDYFDMAPSLLDNADVRAWRVTWARGEGRLARLDP